jgi:hypothetical protein
MLIGWIRYLCGWISFGGVGGGCDMKRTKKQKGAVLEGKITSPSFLFVLF